MQHFLRVWLEKKAEKPGLEEITTRQLPKVFTEEITWQFHLNSTAGKNECHFFCPYITSVKILGEKVQLAWFRKHISYKGNEKANDSIW